MYLVKDVYKKYLKISKVQIIQWLNENRHWQTMIYKVLHRKLNIYQHDPLN
jgi:energy-converting hydrogenase A subunit M